MADEDPPSNTIHNNPKNRWTTKQREVLCVLIKFYQTPLSESVQIFNALFEKELLECKFTDGIPHRSLTTQWFELYRSGSAVFERVQIETLLSDESGRWADLREEIEETAERVGVSLIKRKFEHLRDISKFGSRPQKLHEYTGDDSSDDCENEDAPSDGSLIVENSIPEPNSSSPSTPRRTNRQPQRANNTLSRLRAYPVTPRQRSQQNQRSRDSNRSSSSNMIMITPASGRKQTRTMQVQTPSLLYRYWGTNSNGFNSAAQCVAGLFCNNPQSIYSIASYTPDELNTMTLNHLTRMETPSPYISASATLFSPLHRALQQEVPSAVSIIDVSKIDATTLFSAQKIIREGNLVFPRNYTYRGQNEWLIWREIPANAIICTFTVDSLLKIRTDFPKIESILFLSALQRFKQARRAKSCLRNSLAKVDEPTGIIIGMFLQLLGVSGQYVKQVSETILTAWGFEGVTWDGRGHGENYEQRHESYLRGVLIGYEQQPLLPEPIVEKEIDEGEITSSSMGQDVPSSPVTTPDSSPLGKLQHKEEELEQRGIVNSNISQDGIWSSSPIMTPDSSPLGKLQHKEEEFDQGNIANSIIGQREMWPSSSIITPNPSPWERLSGAPAGLQISIPAGRSRQSQSTLAGLKHEMKEDEIGKDASINPIEWEILDMQEAMEWEAVDAESENHCLAKEEDDDNHGEAREDEIHDEGITTVDEPAQVDRFTAERNRINRLLNYFWSIS